MIITHCIARCRQIIVVYSVPASTLRASFLHYIHNKITQKASCAQQQAQEAFNCSRMERYTTSRVIVGRSTSNQVIELLFVVRIRDYILTILDEVGLSSYNAAISLSRGLNDSGDHCAEDCCNSTWTFFTHSLNWAGSTLTMVIKSKFNSHWSP